MLLVLHLALLLLLLRRIHRHRGPPATHAQDEMEDFSFPNTVFAKSATVLELMASKDETLFIWRNALTLLDTVLDLLDGMLLPCRQENPLPSQSRDHETERAIGCVKGALLLRLFNALVLLLLHDRLDGCDIGTNDVHLLCHRNLAVVRRIVGEHAGGDLVGDEEVHEVLREADLLREAVLGQVEGLLHLGLQVDHEHAEESALQLQGAEGLGEVLLLGREGVDGILELLRSRNGLEQEVNDNVVLVLDENRGHGLERGGRDNAADHEHEAAELPGPGAQLHRPRGAVVECVHHLRVNEALAEEGYLGGGIEGELHRMASLGGVDEGEHLLVVGLEADDALGRVLCSAHVVAEGAGRELLAEEVPLVEGHELEEVFLRHLLANGSL
mmetsp:Transcript_507/g.1767  ORF Transcript_507/g.1767 Transcript_507/m.1767 type:complete len:386 (+) Transcript_507:688-1845(+)